MLLQSRTGLRLVIAEGTHGGDCTRLDKFQQSLPATFGSQHAAGHPATIELRTDVVSGGRIHTTDLDKELIDHWKERVVPAYARQILMRSLTLSACMLLLLLALLASWLLLASWPAGGVQPALDLLSHWQWHALMLVTAWGWAMWRTRRQRAAAAAKDYSEGDKLLHRLALASPSMRCMIDDLDRSSKMGSNWGIT